MTKMEADEEIADVVHVMANGSFACTCPQVASRGAPDRHVFACYRKVYLAFNPYAHLHPNYLRTALQPEADICRFTIPTLLNERMDDSASWDATFEATRAAWIAHGIGSSPVPTNSWISPAKQKKRESQLDDKELIKKYCFEIQEHANKDDESKKRFFDFVARERSIRAHTEGAIQVIDEERVALPAAMRKSTSKRARMASDKRNSAATKAAGSKRSKKKA